MFTLVTCGVVVLGVKNGIERANVVMMPVLLLMAVGLAVYVATLPGAVEGIRYYLVPDFSACDGVGKVVLGAMGQMFYSLSLAMGIMITYGSYANKAPKTLALSAFSGNANKKILSKTPIPPGT